MDETGGETDRHRRRDRERERGGGLKILRQRRPIDR